MSHPVMPWHAMLLPTISHIGSFPPLLQVAADLVSLEDHMFDIARFLPSVK